MNIKEIVFFPTQLESVEMISIKAEKNGEVTEKIKISATSEGVIIDENHGKTIITICVENEGFKIEETKAGLFSFDGKIEDEEEARRFMEIQGVRILWSYVREDIYTISSKMLPVPLTLPTIDVMKTLEKAQ